MGGAENAGLENRLESDELSVKQHRQVQL